MKIKTYLSKLCGFCGLDKKDFEIELIEEQDKVKIFLTVVEEKAGYFIGFKGETLNAIEYMLRIVFRDDSDKRFILDVNDYKKQKEEKLRDQVIKIADQVLESGRARRLFSLNSYERFLIHTMLSDEEEFADLESFSEDEEDGRRVLVIKVKE